MQHSFFADARQPALVRRACWTGQRYAAPAAGEYKQPFGGMSQPAGTCSPSKLPLTWRTCTPIYTRFLWVYIRNWLATGSAVFAQLIPLLNTRTDHVTYDIHSKVRIYAPAYGECDAD